MDDLISRTAAIEAFDDERVDRNYGDVSPESVIKVIESIPAVDAIPVEWLKQKTRHPDSYTRGSAKWMLGCWKREQEAHST